MDERAAKLRLRNQSMQRRMRALYPDRFTSNTTGRLRRSALLEQQSFSGLHFVGAMGVQLRSSRHIDDATVLTLNPKMLCGLTFLWC